MATFSADLVEPLEYDFTGFPSNSGSGNCKGKGVTPEPSDAVLRAYQKGVRELMGVKEDATPDELAKELEKQTKDQTAAEAQKEADEKSKKLLALTAQLCQNQPSVEELEELRPRTLRAFMKHTFKELADPKV